MRRWGASAGAGGGPGALISFGLHSGGNPIKRIVAAVIAALFFVWAPAAVAQTAPSHRAAAVRFVEAMLPGGIYEQVVGQMQTAMVSSFGADDSFPSEWQPLMVEAAREEMLAKRSVLIALIADGFATRFTEAELDAGARFFSAPGGRRILEASMNKRPAPTLSRAEERELKAIEGTPAGKAFFAKEPEIDVVFGGMDSAFVRAVVPGLLRRFGEKAEAYEAARRPAA